MREKIVEYKLIGVSQQERAVVIQNMLDDGYQPYGSPVVGEKNVIVQAFVKYEGEDLPTLQKLIADHMKKNS